MTIDLRDALALLERARHHLRELNELINGDRLWELRHDFDDTSGDWVYSLSIDQQRLVTAKPILADAATNAISALDHVAAAVARSLGQDRNRSLYFPLGLTEAEYQRTLRRAEPCIGPGVAALITDVRTKRYEHVHAEAAKEISNSGKHWELLPASGNARAIGLNEPHQPQRIFQIPADAFDNESSHTFHRGERLPDGHFSILFGFEVEGLTEGLPKSPDTIVDCTLRFVEAIIDAVREADLAAPVLETAG